MKKLIMLIAIIALATVFMTKAEAQEESDNGLVSGSDAVSSEATVLAAKFVKQIDIVANVKINTDILRSAAFNSLTDRTRPIPSESSGRENPFAPY